MKEKHKYFVDKNILLVDAIKILENNYNKILVVVDSRNKLIGTISDGDIRRRLIKSGNINITSGELANKNCIFSNTKDEDKDEIISFARKKRVTVIPVVDNNKEVVDLIEISKPLRSSPVISSRFKKVGFLSLILDSISEITSYK